MEPSFGHYKKESDHVQNLLLGYHCYHPAVIYGTVQCIGKID
jgi:hypothetical protein